MRTLVELHKCYYSGMLRRLCILVTIVNGCGPAALDSLAPDGDVDSLPDDAGRTEVLDDAATHEGSVPKRARAVSLAAGGGHVCAILEDGDVACWGDNTGGEVGTAQPRQLTRPNRVAGLGRPALAVAAGARHTCALLDDRTITCWGQNNLLQRGDSETAVRPSPGLPVATDVLAIASGDFNACAVRNADLTCWGANDVAQIGSPLGPEMSGPSVVDGFPGDLAGVTIGTRFLCGLTQAGSVICRGRNEQGQLGLGTLSMYEASPAPALAPAVTVKRVSAGDRHACALRADGAVTCFGTNEQGQLGATPSDHGPVTIALGKGRAKDVACGVEHTCAVLDDGAVVCWGGNTFGQLGVESSLDGGHSPSRVDGIADAVAVAATSFSTCVLLKDGRVACWGANSHGQLGDGSNDSSAKPKDAALP